MVIADFGIAKHLHSPDEQLHSLAGSFGYVAPEVLNKTGHGKAVDIWSTGIITYVLLCGYSPFRSDDVKDLIRETTEAKIEFHERYWKNISTEAKEFIKSLLNPDPSLRPTAEEALKHKWLTLDAPAEHDLTGLRENFNPKARWRAAIAGARALHRLGSVQSSKSSGGWKSFQSNTTDSSDDDEDDGEVDANQSTTRNNGPGENEHVVVTQPDEEEIPTSRFPNEAHTLKREHEDREPLHEKVPEALQDSDNTSKGKDTVTASNTLNNDDGNDSDEPMSMPGTFHQAVAHDMGDARESWSHLFKKLHLKR